MGSSLVHRSWSLIIIILIVVLSIIINLYDYNNSEATFFYFFNFFLFFPNRIVILSTAGHKSQKRRTALHVVWLPLVISGCMQDAPWERGTNSYVCNGYMGFQTPTTSKHSKLLSSVHHLLAVWPGNLFHANLSK